MTSLWNNLNVIRAIAAKDIVDALKSKLVVSLILGVSVILLLPKALPLIFEQPSTVLPVYDLGTSSRIAGLQNDPAFSVQPVRSAQALNAAVCAGLFPEIGLLIPADFDQVVAAGGPVELAGTVCWNRRFQVGELRPKLEEQLARALGVAIHVTGNIVHPPADVGILMGLTTLNAVCILLMIGLFLTPSLLFEEKETKTMQALLVSPASIGQVVIGKALAGAFYILVTAIVVFAISWADVTHWGLALLFVLGGGIFSIAVGLVLGSLFEKQQDGIGWMTALLIFFVGAMVVKMLGVELPALVEGILPWAPSVALAEICRAAFAETFSATRVLTDLALVLAVSLPLYALVIWKVRRSDR